MDYYYGNGPNPPYVSRASMYGAATSSPPASSRPTHGSSFYPRIGQPGPPVASALGRSSSYQQSSSSPSSSSSGLGIRVALKPEYQITPPPTLLPQVGDIPRSNFQFDFEFERKVLAEAEKGNPDWSRLGSENFPAKPIESTSSLGSVPDPVVNRYTASGLDREAVSIAVANYGDNPTKVREFANGYSMLREMGFTSTNVAEVLLMYDNDTDKALAHVLNNS